MGEINQKNHLLQLSPPLQCRNDVKKKREIEEDESLTCRPKSKNAEEEIQSYLGDNISVTVGTVTIIPKIGN